MKPLKIKVTTPKTTIQKPAEIKLPEANLDLKLSFLKWVSTIFLSIISIGGVLKLVDVFYNPNLKETLDLAKKNLISTEIALPEPKEKLMFILGLLTAVLSLFLFHILVEKLFKNKQIKVINPLYLSILIISLCLFLYVLGKGLSAPNPFADKHQNDHDDRTKTNLDFYFIGTFLYKNFLVFIVFLFPIILSYFVFLKSNSVKINKIFRFVSLGFSLILIFTATAISIFDFPYTFENKYDFNAIYYSVVQVYHGFPLLIDGFTNTYGLYPHFIVPFLKLTGLSIVNFTFIMGLLISICFLLIYYFLAKNVSNKLLVLFGFTSIFFNSYMYARIILPFDPIFSAVPIRWLFPSLLFAFSALYLSENSKLKKIGFLQKNTSFLPNYSINPLKFLSFLFFSMGLLWSPDTGIFTFLGLIAFYSFQEIDIKNLKTTLLKIIIHVILALISAAVVLSIYTFLIKTFYGKSPDIFLMFSTINVFSNLGFGMMPMPTTWHIWMSVALVYLFGLLYSIDAILKQKINAKTTSVFLLTVMGILFFLYYQGRSHNWNLFSLNFPVFILLTIFADELLKLYQSKKIFLIPFGLVLFLLSFSLFQVIFDLNKLTALIESKRDKELFFPENQRIISNAKIIDSLTTDNEKIFVLSAIQNQSIFHSLSKTASAINPGFIDLFKKESYDEMLNNLGKDSLKVFFEPQYYRYYDPKIPIALASMYDLKQEFLNEKNQLWYFTKKKENNLANPIFANRNNILHEFYSKNRSKQSNYFLGKANALKLDKSFTVEIIFKPAIHSDNPNTTSASLLSNEDGEKGFILQQYLDNPNQYVFAVNKKGIACPVNPNAYNYLAFEVNNSQITCFVNGIKIGTVASAAYQNTENPLYIGNYNHRGGVFFGDIAEFRIKNGTLNEAEVKQNFNKMKF